MRKLFLLLLLSLAIYASAQSTSQVVTFTATGSGAGVNLLRTGVAYYQLVWHGAGTRSTCTIAVDSSIDGVSWSAGNIIAGQSCTSDGAFTTTTPAYYNYMRITVTALSGSGNTVTAVVMGWINSPVGTSVSLFAGAPSGACTARQLAVNTVSGHLFDCLTAAWNDISGGGGGSGTVTVVGAGNLTSIAFVTGGGTTTVQTPSATSTLDASGNAVFVGAVTAPTFKANANGSAGAPAFSNNSDSGVYFGTNTTNISAGGTLKLSITTTPFWNSSFGFGAANTQDIGDATDAVYNRPRSIYVATSVVSAAYNTNTNCASAGGTCVAASSGAVSIAAAATTVTVATTAVTANSQIFIQEDSSLGARLSVTCNTTIARNYVITARTAATSFVVTASAAPTVNPACLNYHIVN